MQTPRRFSPPTTINTGPATTIKDYAESELDKQLIALASGGLVLTIAFVKDIVSITKATDVQHLKYSWIAFALCLISVLVSHLFSIFASNAKFKEKINHDKSEFSKAERRRSISRFWNGVAYANNFISIALFIAGVFLFIIFVSNNINGVNKQTTDAVQPANPTITNNNYYTQTTCPKIKSNEQAKRKRPRKKPCK